MVNCVKLGDFFLACRVSISDRGRHFEGCLFELPCVAEKEVNAVADQSDLAPHTFNQPDSFHFEKSLLLNQVVHGLVKLDKVRKSQSLAELALVLLLLPILEQVFDKVGHICHLGTEQKR